MNKLIIELSILLFLGLALSEVHSLVYYLKPETAKIEFDLFLEKAYKQKLTVLWYLYELSGLLNRIIWAYVLCRISNKISFKLYKISVVFFGYHISQFLLYIWNRNTSFIVNWVLYTAMFLIILEIILPDKKQGKIKSLN